MKQNHTIDIIANSLANIYDWASEDLENDFAAFLVSECPTIPYAKAIQIFRDYDNLSPLERDSLDFDYQKFINQYIS